MGIAIVGRYGSDPGFDDQLKSFFDGGDANPTSDAIDSTQSLIDWLSGKYSINKTGTYQLPQTVDGQTSCNEDPSQCYISNIAGHRDYAAVTAVNNTECPGDNLYSFLPKFRGTSSQSGTGTIVSHNNPSGLLIGGFSPVKLGIVNPSGNRMGINPATGLEENNITNGVHGQLELFHHEDDSTDNPYLAHIPSPTSGVYKIDVVGTGTGSFTIAAEDMQTSSAITMTGTTTNNEVDKYQIIYSTSTPNEIEIFNDTIPPVTTGSMTCSRDMLGICRSEAVINLSATDTAESGTPSGVQKIECSYDNKVTWVQCGGPTGGQITFSQNGQHSFWYRSTDRVLNVETAKFSGIIDVQRYLSVASTLFKSASATTLNTTGILYSNSNMQFTNNTTAHLDILNYRGTYSQSGNVTFTYNQKTQVTPSAPIPAYPTSYYQTRCQNFTGNITINDTNMNYNKCVYATGNVLFKSTGSTGKLTIVSLGKITDNSNNSNIDAWDSQNGILFYGKTGYATTANGADYLGMIYSPGQTISGSFSNTIVNGSFFGGTVSFGSGTSLTASQSAGFAATTHTLPL